MDRSPYIAALWRGRPRGRADGFRITAIACGARGSHGNCAGFDWRQPARSAVLRVAGSDRLCCAGDCARPSDSDRRRRSVGQAAHRAGADRGGRLRSLASARASAQVSACGSLLWQYCARPNRPDSSRTDLSRPCSALASTRRPRSRLLRPSRGSWVPVHYSGPPASSGIDKLNLSPPQCGRNRGRQPDCKRGQPMGPPHELLT